MGEAGFYNEDPEYVKYKDNTDLDHIPGDYGPPLIGYTFKYVQQPYESIERMYKRYGEVFRYSSTFQKFVVCVGPEYVRQLTLDSDKVFSARMGYEPALKHFFQGGLLMRDFAAHKFHRRIMQSAFKTEAMRRYVEEMQPLIDTGLAQWGGSADLHFYPRVKELLLDIGAKVFLGLDLENRDTRQLNEAFLAMGEGTLAIIRKDWPLPWLAYRKGMNGRRYLDKYFLELVPRRRGKPGTDMATFFSNETTDSGDLFPDDIVSKHLIFLLLAAHDTTTAALSMACYYLAHHQDWQERLREQALALDGTLSYDELGSVPDIENTFKEVLRLHPSVPAFMRRTVAETELGGYRIPANTPVQIPMIYTQRMEEWWGNPNSFDPDRFAREEHKKHPFMWAPFGGGAHKCIGLHFADMLFKSVLVSMLCRYRFRHPHGASFPGAVQHFPFPKPVNELPLVLEKL